MSSILEYKITLIGNSTVGKTSLFKKLTTGEFSSKIIATIGMDKRSINTEIEVNKNNKTIQKSVNISLIDTAGQERFKSITKSYFKGSDGILLLYDITRKDTFKNVELWLDSINEALGSHKDSKYIIILIGNKKDLIGIDGFEREVNEEESKTICTEKGLIWGGEMSVKTIEPNDLEKSFKQYVKKIYDKVGEKDKNKQIIKKVGAYKKKKRNLFCIH